MFCNRNVRVTVKDGNKHDHFDIYLNVYGNDRYLVSHRYDSRLYSILRKGPAVSDLRLIMNKQESHDLRKKIKYLITTINDYLKYEIDI